MPDRTYFKLLFIFIMIGILLMFFQIFSLIKKICIMNKSAKTSTAFCSIIQINKEELARNIISLILAMLSIMLFGFSNHIMQEYIRIENYLGNYQKYNSIIYTIRPIIYIISAISPIFTLLNSLFPTVITNNYIKINCSANYNREDAVFKLEEDKIIIYHSETKDTIVCIENWRKKKGSILEILKIYYKEEINCHKHSVLDIPAPQSELFHK